MPPQIALSRYLELVKLLIKKAQNKQVPAREQSVHRRSCRPSGLQRKMSKQLTPDLARADSSKAQISMDRQSRATVSSSCAQLTYGLKSQSFLLVKI